jgi:transcriptional regulator with XRE-family HTH domain
MPHHKSNRNTVTPNGQRLRELRAAAGLTQLELSCYLDYSERLVRKAEKSQRIDFTSLVSFKNFFETQGIQVNLDEITLDEKSTEQISLDWFRLCFVEKDIDQALRLCHPKTKFNFQGVAGKGKTQLKSKLAFVLHGFSDFVFSVENCISNLEESAILWSAERVKSYSASPVQSHFVNENPMGTIWLRSIDHAIVSVQDDCSLLGDHATTRPVSLK